MLKRFTFAAIGVLALALAFHVGATTALSSSLDCIEAAYFKLDENRFVVAANGLYQVWTESGLREQVPLPRSGAIAGVYWRYVGNGDGFWVLYRDGELWTWAPGTGGWVLALNVSCGQTAVQPSTWGQIKARAVR